MKTLLAVSMLLVGPVAAQKAPPARRNIVRLDLAGFLFLNCYRLGGTSPAGLLRWPLLLGYERKTGRQTGLAAEVLLGGGDGYEHSSGFSVQGRYYPLPARYGEAPFGGYLAPAFGYRAISQVISSNANHYPVHSRLGGAGLLVGLQNPIGRSGRLVFDVAIGYVAWKRFRDDGRYPSDNATYRESDWAVPDGRLSIGYRL